MHQGVKTFSENNSTTLDHVINQWLYNTQVTIDDISVAWRGDYIYATVVYHK